MENQITKAELERLQGLERENSELNKKLEDAKNRMPFYIGKSNDGNKSNELMKSITAIAGSQISKKNIADTVKQLSDKNEAFGTLDNDLIKTTTFEGGSALIPVQYGQEIIPMLQDNSIFFGAMPRVTMTSDTMKLPKELYHPDVYWGGEIDTYSRASNAEFGDVTLTVKNQSASVVIPNNKIKQALANGVALEESTITNLVAKLTSSAEYQILYGSGINSYPLGIDSKMSSANKTTSAGNTIANINDDIQTLMNFIEGSNVQMNLPTSMFIGSSRTKNQLAWKTTSLEARPFAEVNQGTLAGIPFRASNYIPNNTGTGAQTHLWLIDWSKFVLGIHSDIEIIVDSSGAYRDSAGTLQSARHMDVTVIYAKLKFDFGMWYDKAAAKLTALNYNN